MAFRRITLRYSERKEDYLMTRRRSSRSRRSSRNDLRLRGSERVVFILGATLYLVGLFGGIGLLDMPASTAILLLALGGGLQLAVSLTLIF